MRVSAFLLALCIAGTATASAQSLADVARKENERRQTVKDGGKTWTNQDLKPVPPAPAEAAAEPAGAPTEPVETPEAAEVAKPDEQAAAGEKADQAGATDEVKDQAYWSKRMADLQAQLERDETFSAALQARVDALTTDFVNRDDPAQRAQIAADRQKALAELDRVKKSIEQGKRAIPALEEEARREGVPAGWLR